MSTNDVNEYKRPVSVAYLVFGLVFTGIAGIWFLGQATDTDLTGSAIGFPLVLIGAGVIGLVASLAGSRRRARIAAAEYAAYRAAYDAHYATPPAAPDPGTPETVAEQSGDDTVVLETPASPTTTPEENS